MMPLFDLVSIAVPITGPGCDRVQPQIVYKNLTLRFGENAVFWGYLIWFFVQNVIDF